MEQIDPNDIPTTLKKIAEILSTIHKSKDWQDAVDCPEGDPTIQRDITYAISYVCNAKDKYVTTCELSWSQKLTQPLFGEI